MTTQEVVRSRVHLRMLSGDYPCQYYIGRDRNQDTACLICKQLLPPPHQTEDMEHLLTSCRGTADTRSKILPDMLNEISRHFPNNLVLTSPGNLWITQFILDPTSLNLPMTARISPDHPALPHVLSACRNYCFIIHKNRSRLIRRPQDTKQSTND